MPAATWMNLEHVMLSEIIQSETNTVFPLIGVSYNIQIHGDRKDGECQGLALLGNGDGFLMGTEISFAR